MLNTYANLYKITGKISTNLATIWWILTCAIIILCAGFIAMTKLADIHYFIYLNGIGWDNEDGLYNYFIYVIALFKFLFNWHVFIYYFSEFKI